MPVFEGRNVSSATEVAANIPKGIMSFSVVMNTGGSLDIYIGEGSLYTKIFSALSLDTGDNLYSKNPIKVLANKNIYIVTTGNIDYYFSIEQ